MRRGRGGRSWDLKLILADMDSARPANARGRHFIDMVGHAVLRVVRQHPLAFAAPAVALVVMVVHGLPRLDRRRRPLPRHYYFFFALGFALFTASLNLAPAVNFGTVAAAILISLPV